MKDFVTVLKQVFGRAEYLLLFIATTTTVLVGAVAVRNWSLLTQVIESSTLTLVQKLFFLTTFIGSLDELFGTFGSVLLILISLLFAINFAFLIYYIRRVKKILKGSKRIQAVGIGGLVSGLLGIGCAACGSIVLTAILSSIGASGLLLILPLHGSEFGILGILLLGFSIFMLARKIKEPLVC